LELQVRSETVSKLAIDRLMAATTIFGGRRGTQGEFGALCLVRVLSEQSQANCDSTYEKDDYQFSAHRNPLA
jgi:hypothetical protein